jgi:hypothetical protein
MKRRERKESDKNYPKLESVITNLEFQNGGLAINESPSFAPPYPLKNASSIFSNNDK